MTSSFLALSEQLDTVRAGAKVPRLPSADDSDDDNDDNDAAMRHALEDEHSDRGTISMPSSATTDAMSTPQARLFSGDFVPQRQLTLDEVSL
jgi:hypothetical protein